MKKIYHNCMIAVLVVTVLISSISFVEISAGAELESAQNITEMETPAAEETPPAQSDQSWNLDYMDVPEAWDLIDQLKPRDQRTAADKIKVATLDTGVNYDHPDLQKNIDTAHCVMVAGKEAPYAVYKKPKFGHGTATAGIIAATSNNGKGMNGIAAGNHNDLISLMAINVFRDEKYSAQCSATTKDIIKGINYACENGARVINMCLGHSSQSKDSLGKRHDDKALERAINHAVKQNVVVVCSAGNHNDSRVWYPSDFNAAISVISTKQYTDAWSRKCKARSSSYGPKKDISAPGRAVKTTTLSGGYRNASGTSMAAPSVAAVVALMLYVNPDLTVKQVKEILYSTATDLADTGYDIYTGYGNVNAYKAVAAAAGLKLEIKASKLS